MPECTVLMVAQYGTAHATGTAIIAFVNFIFLITYIDLLPDIRGLAMFTFFVLLL
jgi:hypothetical protein